MPMACACRIFFRCVCERERERERKRERERERERERIMMENRKERGRNYAKKCLKILSIDCICECFKPIEFLSLTLLLV